MKCPPELLAEGERLVALSSYGLRAEQPLSSLDPVVRIAARMFDAPIAAVNMIGSAHVFFAASHGIEGDGEGVDLRRDVSFCAHAITQDEVLVVPDATLDERFHDNPLVTGAAGIRFYAGVPLRSPEGHALGALCVIDNAPRSDFSDDDCMRLRDLAQMATDRLELRRVELALERAGRPFEAYAKNSPTAMIWFDREGSIVAWNEPAALLYRYPLSDGIGRSIEALLPLRDRSVVHELVEQASAAGSVDGMAMPEKLSGLRSDGSEFPLGLSLFCWHDEGRLLFNVHVQDMTSRLRKRDELHRLANTDVLTGLLSRAEFYRRMEEVMLEQSTAAVLMIDLDGFKDVNDTLGHQTGDDVLCEVARRLKAMVTDDDAVCRMGGDEFALLLSGRAQVEHAVQIARACLARIAEPIAADGHEVRVAASCGVAVAPLHAREALELVGNADLALFKAKKIGRGQAFVFVQGLREEATERRLHSIELHRAVTDSEFVLFYQPQVRLGDGSLHGAEALIRWNHPTRGLLSPAAFLPALESGPLAAVVGVWVLDEACSQAAYWRRHGARDLRIGVNLFGVQFRVGDLVADVTSALQRHGLPPWALEVEVTENIVLDHDDQVLESLRRLRALGVGIAFDDFGTGYAALSVLREYPLSRIKIDRTFVRDMNQSDRDASVVRAILDMARSFGLESIAEGIENEQQRARLLAFGCQEGQGYLFGKPVHAIEFAETFGIGRGLLKAASK